MDSIHPISDSSSARFSPGEIETALRIANPGYEHCGRLSFESRGEFLGAATRWRDASFAPILLPVFLQTLGLARSGFTREIVALDRQLAPASADSKRLTLQGRKLIELTGDPRGERLLRKLHTAVREDQMPGHFPILFAARCAVFSLSDRTAVGAFILQEFLAGAPDTPAGLATTFAADCIDQLNLPAHGLRAA